MSDWDGETTAHAAAGPQWVSAAEAADAAGVTPGTVRYWARNGLIVSEVVQGPAGERTLVRLDEVLQHARQGGGHAAASGHAPAGGPGASGQVVTDLPARTSELAPILKSIPEIMAQLTAATDRAARAETKVEFLSAQLAEARRRLADAEAGRPTAPDPVMPAGWDEPHRPARPAEVEPPGSSGEDSPGVTGWPAPPESSLRDDAAYTPADEASWASDTSAPAPAWGSSAGDAEPGPESIDWGSGSMDDAPPEDEDRTGAEEVPAMGTEPATGGVSLEEIWAQPARRDRDAVTHADAPAPADAIQWHEPARGEAEQEAPPPPPPARRANADIPDETFYGPRRRRWFRRR